MTEISCNRAGDMVVKAPIPVVLYCPDCRRPHIDKDEWATRPHRRHLCEFCKMIWRPCLYPTVGVSLASLEVKANPSTAAEGECL